MKARSQLFKMELSDQQTERIIRAWSENLDNAVSGFISNVDTQSLKILKKVLLEIVGRIDKSIQILEG